MRCTAGSISDGSANADYRNDMNCAWHITGPGCVPRAVFKKKWQKTAKARAKRAAHVRGASRARLMLPAGCEL